MGNPEKIKLIECPRDAMQGIKDFIPTHLKAKYINAILSCGFDTVDFGSFVSPKAIPQMRDTADVLSKLNLDATSSKLLAIVANSRGAEDACRFDEINYLGYPFSISEIFQVRNTNKTIKESFLELQKIINLASKHNKQVVTYLSMGFGNPYGDPWNVDIVGDWVEKLYQAGVQILSLSDTVGTSTPDSIEYLFKNLIPLYPKVEFGAHLHTTPSRWHQKLEAAYLNGCKRFDGAIKGYGGCPMATNALTGNMPTEKMLSFFTEQKALTGVNSLRFESAYNVALQVF
ncbi:hydroxymethylglutaryl-CoA lyase [Wenyingzhuangia sp. IMCC45533]